MMNPHSNIFRFGIAWAATLVLALFSTNAVAQPNLKTSFISLRQHLQEWHHRGPNFFNRFALRARRAARQAATDIGNAVVTDQTSPVKVSTDHHASLDVEHWTMCTHRLSVRGNPSREKYAQVLLTYDQTNDDAPVLTEEHYELGVNNDASASNKTPFWQKLLRLRKGYVKQHSSYQQNFDHYAHAWLADIEAAGQDPRDGAVGAGERWPRRYAYTETASYFGHGDLTDLRGGYDMWKSVAAETASYLKQQYGQILQHPGNLNLDTSNYMLLDSVNNAMVIENALRQKLPANLPFQIVLSDPVLSEVTADQGRNYRVRTVRIRLGSDYAQQGKGLSFEGDFMMALHVNDGNFVDDIAMLPHRVRLKITHKN